MRQSEKDALIAGGLSLVVPGLGQIVHRAYVVGAFWLIMTVLFWYSTRSWLWFVPHVLAALSAYWAVQRAAPPAKRRRAR